jgi:hypothetical protein
VPVGGTGNQIRGNILVWHSDLSELAQVEMHRVRELGSYIGQGEDFLFKLLLLLLLSSSGPRF